MIRAVLFDLDGTLLHYDFDRFIDEYMKALGASMAHLVQPDKLISQVLSATEVMVRNRDPRKTNQQVFVDDFFAAIGLPREALMPVFDQFYRNDFPRLRERLQIRVTPAARTMIEHLMSEGADVVIATNPVFPLPAIEERIRWAGLGGLPYRLITSYETMHFCKPNPEYFLETASIIGRRSDECLMVGNDADEDIVAGAVGMKTYLVLDFVLDRGGSPHRHRPDFRGSFASLVDFALSGALLNA